MAQPCRGGANSVFIIAQHCRTNWLFVRGLLMFGPNEELASLHTERKLCLLSSPCAKTGFAPPRSARCAPDLPLLRKEGKDSTTIQTQFPHGPVWKKTRAARG